MDTPRTAEAQFGTGRVSVNSAQDLEIELIIMTRQRNELLEVVREILSQLGQGGENGKIFARDSCIVRARRLVEFLS
jgi:hypothetical protein